MGNRHAVLSPEKLEQYQDCTYFSKSEIVKYVDGMLYRRFRELSPEIVPSFMPNDCVESVLVPPQFISAMPELKDNPFMERIIRVFSEDGSGHMNFENFMDMFNVYHVQAAIEIKTYFAYKIFDNDQDGSLNASDIKWVVQRVTRCDLTDKETSTVVDKVFEESEMDDDHEISFMEFEHVVARAPEFKRTFRLRI